MATDTATRELKKGDRVVNVEPLRGVPEETAGKIHLVNGVGPWTRYWVQFDNGVWMGSIGAGKLVRRNELGDFKQRREEDAKRAAEEASKPKEAPKAEAAAGDAGGAAASGPASKVPAHLLERSKRARERKAGAGAE